MRVVFFGLDAHLTVIFFVWQDERTIKFERDNKVCRMPCNLLKSIAFDYRRRTL